MRIIVVGVGKVGYTLAEVLAREKHDVVIIDDDDEVIRRAEDDLDVLCIHGNGADAADIMNAGADRSDIIIASTDSDEVNMLCCVMAKRMGTKYAIARIRDPKYYNSLELLQSAMDIDLVVNPERATALEISRLLRFPFAANIETFAKGRVELVSFLAKNDQVIGIPLSQMAHKLPGLPQVLYAAVERNGEVIIPNGDFVIQQDDRVHVAADLITTTHYFSHLNRNPGKIKNVMILGGGRISYYLAKIIIPLGIRVSIIEINEEKAIRLSEQLPEANIIYGDGTDQELLEQEGISTMDAFVALSDRDEENLMTGMFAKKCGVSKTIVKNNRSAYNEILVSMGLDSSVSAKDITCSYLLRYVRGRLNANGTKLERVYRLVDGKAEVLEFIARAGDSYIGIPIKNLHIKPECLIAVIVRNGKVIIPFGNDHIEEKDRVVVISRGSGIVDLNEVVHK